MQKRYFYFLLIFLSWLNGFSQTPGPPGFVPIPLSIELVNQSLSPVPVYTQKRPKIAIALSGGGARGLAQIGVLKVFERNALPVDGIAGTSIGAVIGGLAAVGYSANELDSLAHTIEWMEIIQDQPPRKQLYIGQKEDRARHILQVRFQGLSPELPSSYAAGQKFTDVLNQLILQAPEYSHRDFFNFQIPFIAVTTDLLSGKKVLLQNGSLAKAIRASMSIPLLFTPVVMDSMLLADGGLVQNLPVSETALFKPDLIIAVDTSTKLKDAKSLDTPWELADQVTTIMHRDILEKELKKADIVIQPDLQGYGNMDFTQVDSLIFAGERAALAALPSILSFLDSVSTEDDSGTLPVSEVIFSSFELTQSRTADAIFGWNTTDPVPLSEIIWAGQSLIQTGEYESVQAFYDSAQARLLFRVKENPMIRDITFYGNQLLSDSLLISMIKTKPGQLFNPFLWQNDQKNILRAYHKKGYSLAHISETLLQDGRLHIVVDEGRLSNIRITGNTRSKPFILRREIHVKPGDRFNLNNVSQGVQNIYSTGYFEEVHFDISKNNSLQDLVIHVEERPYTLLKSGYCYDTERQSRGFFELVEENIFGIGAEGYATGLFGTREHFGHLGLRADRLMSTYLTAQANIGISNKDYSYYQDLNRQGKYTEYTHFFQCGFGQQMERLGTLWLEFCSERFHINSHGDMDVPEEKITLTTVTLRTVVDTRDRVPFPRTGRYHQLEAMSGVEFLGSDLSFFRLLSSLESYSPVNKRFVFHSRLQWATADLTTPFSKQFFLGGMESFLGLPERALSGKRYFLASVECRYQIPWFRWIENYLSLRYDFGGIWGKYSKIASSDFKHGIGGSYAINTPLGPLCLGYGRMSDGLSRFYFSAGHKF